MLSVNRHPSRRELRTFGVLLMAFVALAGGLAFWRTGSPTWAVRIWTGGGLLALLYHLAPPTRRPIYLGWTYAAFPIGWTVSHLLMAAVYFGVITPIGLVLRGIGRGPLAKHPDPSARTYWVRHTPGREVARYFKQF